MFTVRWTRSALNELATLWTQADSALRQAITAATNQIDQELQQDPESKGESREGNERILFVFPLGIRYEVDRQRSIVRVLHVWSYRRRGQKVAASLRDVIPLLAGHARHARL